MLRLKARGVCVRASVEAAETAMLLASKRLIMLKMDMEVRGVSLAHRSLRADSCLYTLSLAGCSCCRERVSGAPRSELLGLSGKCPDAVRSKPT